MLLTGKNEIRLADLGLAKLMFESHASSYAGSPAYMSPEVFKSLSENEIYYPNADVWYLRSTFNHFIEYDILIIDNIH